MESQQQMSHWIVLRWSPSCFLNPGSYGELGLLHIYLALLPLGHDLLLSFWKSGLDSSESCHSSSSKKWYIILRDNFGVAGKARGALRNNLLNLPSLKRCPQKWVSETVYHSGQPLEGGRGEAASWRINQRAHSETQGHPGPWSLVQSSWDLMRLGGSAMS